MASLRCKARAPNKDERPCQLFRRNAGEQPGLRRRKWRLQPPLPNRRRPLHPTRPQTSVLVAQPLLAVYGLKDVHGERNRGRSVCATKSLQLKKTVRNKRIISAKARSDLSAIVFKHLHESSCLLRTTPTPVPTRLGPYICR